MSNKYLELKTKHKEELNKFPIVFAFSKEQFEKAMEELGFSVQSRNYVGNIASINGGGYIRKSDADGLNEMIDRHENELTDAIESDHTGEGFIYDMFSYELANHEYGYTYELNDTLHALGFSMKDVNEHSNLMHGLKLACEEIRKADI